MCPSNVPKRSYFVCAVTRFRLPESACAPTPLDLFRGTSGGFADVVARGSPACGNAPDKRGGVHALIARRRLPAVIRRGSAPLQESIHHETDIQTTSGPLGLRLGCEQACNSDQVRGKTGVQN
jgi:hypothetical protein